MGEIATYLGPKGYSIKKEYLSIEEQELIRRELMLKPFVPKSSMAKPTPFPVYRESKKKFYVPRFYGINTYGKPDATTITDGETIDLSFCGDLRPFQKPIVAKFVNCAKSSGAGLLEIHCGGGKTVMALNIISILGKKTLIIVHKEFLLRQWEERIAQFLPGARVGRIQGEIICMDDKDIVIGMLQSLSMNFMTSISDITPTASLSGAVTAMPDMSFLTRILTISFTGASCATVITPRVITSLTFFSFDVSILSQGRRRYPACPQPVPADRG